MIKVGVAYALAGVMFAAIAVFTAADASHPRRWRNAGFWGLLAVSFLFGDLIGDLGNGVLVLALVLIGGVGGLGLSQPATTTGPEREALAARFGARLFLPILLVPLTALVGSLAFKAVRFGGHPLFDPAQVTVISLALGVVLALIAAMALARPPAAAPIQEARRLLDSVGWAAILPQLLAALGAIFTLAGVGRAVGALIGPWLPLDDRFAVVAAYGVGMMLFTVIMGNAFAALPVMVAALGAPLLIGRFGGDAAAIGALGMLCGYCGTLMTPMAAHNIVPAALLGLAPGAVIRVQAPTALLVLLANLALMEALAFRHPHP
jgi:uncharacterized membrane protein